MNLRQITSAAASFVAITVLGFQSVPAQSASAASADTSQGPTATIFEGERFFKNVRQLTFGGQNAEAYFNYGATQLIFQATVDSFACDQIFTMNSDGSDKHLVSTGRGRTTCSFIAPDGRSITYCSTHLAGDACPPDPDMSQGYVWALYKSYDIFKADPDGSNLIRLTDTPGYDAEAVWSPRGDKIAFTSARTGDLEIYLMNPDGSGVEQLTDAPGYDGGPFFSFDGKWICYRASRPQGQALADYKRLLDEGLIRPTQLDLYIMNLTDRKPIRLTDNGAANFGPYFHPDGRHIIFASNMHDPETGRRFDLFMIDTETKEIQQVTNNPTFDGFPMFSHDGTRLVFASNRDNKVRGETNIFIADWVWPDDE